MTYIEINQMYFHPEQKNTEVYLFNLTPDLFWKLKFQNKRTGWNSYDQNGNKLLNPQLFPIFIELYEYYKIRIENFNKLDCEENLKSFPFPGYIIEFQIKGYDDIQYGIITQFNITCKYHTVALEDIKNWWFVDKDKTRILDISKIDLQTLRTNETELSKQLHFLNQYFN